MKNADVLRMAEALLTPAATSVNPSSASSDSGSTAGDNTINQLSLTDASTSLGKAVSTAASTIVTVAVDDPRVRERLSNLLETTVRLLYPKGLLEWRELPQPVYPLTAEDEFGLPDGLAPAAAYHTAWLLTGETRLYTAYQAALDVYLSTLEAVVEKIVEKY